MNNVSIDTFVVVGESKDGSFLTKEQGYLQFPVSDEYYANSYKVHQIFSYAILNNYDIVVKIDDDAILNKEEYIKEIVSNYDPQMYLAPRIWNYNRRTLKSIYEQDFLIRIKNKRVILASDTFEICHSYPSGTSYVVGSDHFHKFITLDFLTHYIEDVKGACMIGYPPQQMKTRIDW